jgi:lipopolysaccharide export system protein LptA
VSAKGLVMGRFVINHRERPHAPKSPWGPGLRRSIIGMAIVMVFGFALTVSVAHSVEATSGKRRALTPEQLASRQAAASNGSLTSVKKATTGSELPVQITTRKLRVKYAEGLKMAICEGNVEVKQGDVTLTCERLVIESDTKGAKQSRDSRGTPKQLPVDLQKGSEMKSITAEGNVKLVQGQTRALAGKAVFDNVNRTITLSDNPKLWQGPDHLSGERIIIYPDKGSFEVLPGEGKNKEPIKITIDPGGHKKEQEK